MKIIQYKKGKESHCWYGKHNAGLKLCETFVSLRDPTREEKNEVIAFIKEHQEMLNRFMAGLEKLEVIEKHCIDL